MFYAWIYLNECIGICLKFYCFKCSKTFCLTIFMILLFMAKLFTVFTHLTIHVICCHVWILFCLDELKYWKYRLSKLPVLFNCNSSLSIFPFWCICKEKMAVKICLFYMSGSYLFCCCLSVCLSFCLFHWPIYSSFFLSFFCEVSTLWRQ